MFYGTNFGVGKFIYQCVIPVTLGNIIGGAGLVGSVLWFLYGRDDDLVTGTAQSLNGEQRKAGDPETPRDRTSYMQEAMGTEAFTPATAGYNGNQTTGEADLV
jgi:hypothetical protein